MSMNMARNRLVIYRRCVDLRSLNQPIHSIKQGDLHIWIHLFYKTT